MTRNQAIAELKVKDKQIEELTSHAEELVKQNEGLRQQIATLQRRLYGPRSERYEPGQLFLDDVLKDSQGSESEEPKGEIPVKATVRRKARPHGRLKIPDDIERVDKVLDLPEEEKIDPETGKPLVKLRDEISEKIAWRGGQWYAIRFIRPVYVPADKNGEKTGVYMAEMPDSPIDKSKADTSVLALVGVNKYVDHLPLYRQAEIFKRGGMQIASSTLNAWAVEPMLVLEKLYKALLADILSRPCLFTDDSPVAMLDPGRKKTRSARIWVYVGGCGPPYRYFDFTEDRRRERPIAVLKDYKGYVHADAYGGYDELFKKSRHIIEVGCWAHARRKFDEAKNSSVEQCSEVLARIGRLYKVEDQVRGRSPDERLAFRQSESVGLLDQLYRRFEQMRAEALPASAFGQALTYVINQREALCRYVTDGRLEIDNNIAENAIRPLALGRKNWLFTGSQRGGRACAIALSLLQSAKACGLNPYDYLHDIYNRIMSHPVSKLSMLLPDAWRRARQKD